MTNLSNFFSLIQRGQGLAGAQDGKASSDLLERVHAYSTYRFKLEM